MNIYVGNLSKEISEGELRQAFEAFGAVSKVSIIKDNFTGDSRGFAFVEMSTDTEAEAAISGLNGREMSGRELNVNQARPRADKPGGDRGPRGGGRDRW
jgi:RNA recognition motif-containing protein